MSYETDNYIMLALSVPDFIDITKDTKTELPVEGFSKLLKEGSLQLINEFNDNYVSAGRLPLHNFLKELLKSYINASKESEDLSNVEARRTESRYMGWLKQTINLYIHEQGYEEEIDIISTSFGTIHQLGGMKMNIPYIVIGDIECCELEDWEDPRSQDPEFFEDFIKDCFGESGSKQLEVLSPLVGS
jgi:hypothetical protein